MQNTKNLGILWTISKKIHANKQKTTERNKSNLIVTYSKNKNQDHMQSKA